MIPEYVLRVSPQELQVLVGCMHEAPYKVVAGLLGKLQSQITEQETAATTSNGGFGIPSEKPNETAV